MYRSLICCLSCLVLSLAAIAQLPTSTLNGTVTDPQGGVVAGAKVVITNTATGASREVTTAGDGGYAVTDLTPGNYSVRVTASGFATSEFKDLRLEVGRASTLNVSLKIAGAGQVVEVTAGEIAVNLTQSEVEGLVSSTTVENIPLNGRNYLELAFLIPGNRPATNYDPTKTNTLEVSSAGQFGRGNNLTVDGGSNVDVVVGGTLLNFPQDSVQEFQIATNHFTAEVGNSGSSIINIATKSGTNDLHGSLFGFFRNKNLQGRAAVEDRTQPKPPFDRQQFGGSVGGPILKNRAWFFLSGEDRNQHAAVQVGQRKFGATPTIIVTGAAAPLDDLLTLGKLDFKLSSKDDFYVRYAYNRSIETANGSLGRPLGTAANRQNSLNRFNSFYGNWTRTFSSHLVNTVIENTNTFVNNIPAFSSSADTLCAGAGGYAGGCGTNPPGIGLTPPPVVEPAELRFASLQDGLNFRIPQRTRANTYEIQDALTWARGSHTFHFGGRIQRQLIDALFDRNGSQPISLAQNFATQDLDGDGVINDLDIPISSVIVSTAPLRPPTYPTYSNTALGWYVQDDWRIKSNLTLNLGLRYDFDTNVFANNGSFQGCPSPLTTPPTQTCVWLRTLLGAKPHRDTADLARALALPGIPSRPGRLSFVVGTAFTMTQSSLRWSYLRGCSTVAEYRKGLSQALCAVTSQTATARCPGRASITGRRRFLRIQDAGEPAAVHTAAHKKGAQRSYFSSTPTRIIR